MINDPLQDFEREPAEDDYISYFDFLLRANPDCVESTFARLKKCHLKKYGRDVEKEYELLMKKLNHTEDKGSMMAEYLEKTHGIPYGTLNITTRSKVATFTTSTIPTPKDPVDSVVGDDTKIDNMVDQWMDVQAADDAEQHENSPEVRNTSQKGYHGNVHLHAYSKTERSLGKLYENRKNDNLSEVEWSSFVAFIHPGRAGEDEDHSDVEPSEDDYIRYIIHGKFFMAPLRNPKFYSTDLAGTLTSCGR